FFSSSRRRHTRCYRDWSSDVCSSDLKYIKNYGMSIVGVRPANVTGPDKVRGSTDHVQIMTEAARGKPVHLPKQGLMRLLIHVEEDRKSVVEGKGVQGGGGGAEDAEQE